MRFRHDRRGRADILVQVHVMIDDFYTLQIFLDDLFTGELNVLVHLLPGALADAVDHVLFDENADLFGQVGAGGQFGHPLAHNRPFRQIALPDSDHILIRRIATVALSVVRREPIQCRRSGMIRPL